MHCRKRGRVARYREGVAAYRVCGRRWRAGSGCRCAGDELTEGIGFRAIRADGSQVLLNGSPKVMRKPAFDVLADHYRTLR
jgi:hypothetical protein